MSEFIKRAPALHAGNLARPALQSAITLFLAVMISMMATVKPAQAEGDVNPSATYWGGGNHSGFNCTGMASPESVQGCEVAKREKWLANDYNYFAGLGVSVPSCPSPVLADYGPAGNYADRFSITYYRVAYNCGIGYNCRYITFCNLQPVVNFNITEKLTCPTNATTLYPPCTCKDGYLPDPSKTRCNPEQYTISLVGLGVEVMPNKKLETAYALVTRNDGKGKSGAQVTLLYDFIPEDDGYNHDVGQHVEPHRGSVSATSGSTDANGKFSFVFQAPEAGGTHLLVAGCTNCTNTDSGKITVQGCKTKDIREVDDIPPNGPDVLPLTQVLERTWGEGLALLPAAQAGLDCVKAKFPGVKISGGTRTVAYQAHLREVWDKLIELDNLKDPAQIRACKPLRDKIKAHNSCGGNGHCITYKPAKNSDHPRGDAFDISGIEDLLGKLRPPPDLQLPPRPPLTPAQERQADVRLIADWLASPPTCNLVWGGSYGDIVHFSIP